MDVTVVIGTFGSPDWIDLAHNRALPSAQALGCRVIHTHRDTLHNARNAGLEQVETEWVIHLDADDELDPGYLDAMVTGTADLRAPAVSYIRDGRSHHPKMPRVAGHGHDCTAECLPEGNWLVIGTLARTQLLRDVGGWRDFAWSEDWSMWARCWKAGATIEAIPAAIYRAHVRYDSRNRAPDRAAKQEAHWAIHRDTWPELHEQAAA